MNALLEAAGWLIFWGEVVCAASVVTYFGVQLFLD